MSQSSSLIQSFRSIDTLTQEVIQEFQQTIHNNRFFTNLVYLQQNSALIAFDKRSWHLRPENFALDYYGISDFFHIILIVNNISSRFNFRQDKFKYGIKTPNLEAIRNVLSQNII